MNHQDQHINSLLAKLANGSISDREKYELQKYSLDDPFLADAVEGYLDNKSDMHQSNIESIEKAVRSSKEPKAKTVPIWIRYSPLALAASLLLLVVIYQPWSEDNDLSESISEVSIDPESVEDIAYQESTDLIEFVTEDRSEKENIEGFSKSKRSAPQKNEETYTEQILVDKPVNDRNSSKKEADGNVMGAEIASAELDYESSKTKLKSMKSGFKQIIGTVSDDTEQKLVGAKVLEAHSQQLISQTDIEGNFIIDIDTNIRTIEIAQAGYLPQLVDLSKVNSDTLAIKLLDNSYAVVDEVRYGNMMPKARSDLEEESIEPKDTLPYQPIGGYKAFDTYINNLKIKEGADLKGTIEIEFEILKEGKVDLVDIIKSDFTREEAIMIAKWIRNGPAWKASYYPVVGKYQIEF